MNALKLSDLYRDHPEEANAAVFLELERRGVITPGLSVEMASRLSTFQASGTVPTLPGVCEFSHAKEAGDTRRDPPRPLPALEVVVITPPFLPLCWTEWGIAAAVVAVCAALGFWGVPWVIAHPLLCTALGVAAWAFYGGLTQGGLRDTPGDEQEWPF